MSFASQRCRLAAFSSRSGSFRQCRCGNSNQAAPARHGHALCSPPRLRGEASCWPSVRSPPPRRWLSGH
eukprot:12111681-Alexandrium_andersonii.AAC.1